MLFRATFPPADHVSDYYPTLLRDRRYAEPLVEHPFNVGHSLTLIKIRIKLCFSGSVYEEGDRQEYFITILERFEISYHKVTNWTFGLTIGEVPEVAFLFLHCLSLVLRYVDCHSHNRKAAWYIGHRILSHEITIISRPPLSQPVFANKL